MHEWRERGDQTETGVCMHMKNKRRSHNDPAALRTAHLDGGGGGPGGRQQGHFSS